MRWQWSEVVELALTLALLLPFLTLVRRMMGRRETALLVASYLAMMTGYTATLLEGFALPPLFNALEHLSYAAGGAFLLLALRRRYASVRPMEGDL